MSLKRVILWFGMLFLPMLWYGIESMVCYSISMLCCEISFCYAIVYVVKDRHSATVYVLYLNVFDRRSPRIKSECNTFIIF